MSSYLQIKFAAGKQIDFSSPTDMIKNEKMVHPTLHLTPSSPQNPTRSAKKKKRQHISNNDEE